MKYAMNTLRRFTIIGALGEFWHDTLDMPSFCDTAGGLLL